MPRVILITEPIAQEGIDLLRYELPEAQIEVRLDLSLENLLAIIGNYTVLILRSQTRVTDELLAKATHLQVIGRAGSGLDNIDLDARDPQHGVLVVHAPRAMRLRSPNIPWRCCWHWCDTFPQLRAVSRRAGGTRSRLLGVELHHEVLGILGWDGSARKWPAGTGIRDAGDRQ